MAYKKTNYINMDYSPVIGLEIHVELKTKSKMFCGCDAHHFQVEPNTHTCPVCLGLPGALPVPNRKAIEWCQLIGLALNCELATESKFDRKNYFYPDLAKGYQISQYDQPLCFKGEVILSNRKKIGITRVHMEEDTGKNQHRKIDGKDVTLVDYNRSGVPLVEIVTEPDFNNSDDVDEFLKGLRRLIRYLGVSDADMEKGSMRLEVNMSLQKPGETGFPPYKVEVKNINSFRFVKKAIDYEYKRQSEILDQGEIPPQETRGYQEDVNKTISQRSKEEAHDYRYYPEPDIPPMEFDHNEIEAIRQQLPELPDNKQIRFSNQYDLASDTSIFLTETPELATYFEAAASEGKKANIQAKEIANAIKNKKVDWEKIAPSELVSILAASKSDSLNDEDEINKIIDQIILENIKEVAAYKAGKFQLLGFFVGQVMRASKGKANPQLVNRLLTEKLQNLK